VPAMAPRRRRLLRRHLDPRPNSRRRRIPACLRPSSRANRRS